MNVIKSLGTVVVMLFLLSGCASVSAIDKNLENLVDLSNGVDEQEAKIIAQKEITGMYEQQSYRITAPGVNKTPEALAYSDHWFIVFGRNWFSPISRDSMAKTYTELSQARYVVVINKLSGEIKFSGEWYFKRDKTFDWVFNREAYRQNNVLNLAPYSDGHPIGNSI